MTNGPNNSLEKCKLVESVAAIYRVDVTSTLDEHFFVQAEAGATEAYFHLLAQLALCPRRDTLCVTSDACIVANLDGSGRPFACSANSGPLNSVFNTRMVRSLMLVPMVERKDLNTEGSVDCGPVQDHSGRGSAAKCSPDGSVIYQHHSWKGLATGGVVTKKPVVSSRLGCDSTAARESAGYVNVLSRDAICTECGVHGCACSLMKRQTSTEYSTDETNERSSNFCSSCWNSVGSCDCARRTGCNRMQYINGSDGPSRSRRCSVCNKHVCTCTIRVVPLCGTTIIKYHSRSRVIRHHGCDRPWSKGDIYSRCLV